VVHDLRRFCPRRICHVLLTHSIHGAVLVDPRGETAVAEGDHAAAVVVEGGHVVAVVVAL
jgi:hypothetical protein